MSTQELSAIYKQLCSEWNSSHRNLKTVGQLLDDLKEKFLLVPFLPTKQEEKSRSDLLVMQRDTLELCALYAIETKNVAGFERAIAQLKHYYNEVKHLETQLGESPQKYMMLGLNLMHLLSHYKLADFHMELELLPLNIVASNVYITHPVKLEQFLMEGTYNKIFLSKANAPAPYYNFFMDVLLDTVRKEIGACMEKAYVDLKVVEAARMLFFGDASAEQDVLNYAHKRGWVLSNDKKVFVFVDPSKKKLDDSLVPAERLARNNIFYAKQLEMIV